MILPPIGTPVGPGTPLPQKPRANGWAITSLVTGNHSGWLRIVCSNDRILRVFRITGLDKVFGIHDSLEDALAA